MLPLNPILKKFWARTDPKAQLWLDLEPWTLTHWTTSQSQKSQPNPNWSAITAHQFLITQTTSHPTTIAPQQLQTKSRTNPNPPMTCQSQVSRGSWTIFYKTKSTRTQIWRYCMLDCAMFMDKITLMRYGKVSWIIWRVDFFVLGNIFWYLM